jgi:methyl-accepting chemotaxis protein
MSKLLAHFRIGVQIGVIGCVGILGLLAVGAVYLYASNVQTQSDRVSDRAAEAEALVGALRVDMLEARRQEKNFQLRRQDEYVRQHAATMAQATQHLAALESLHHDEAETRLIKQVGDGMQLYATAFADLARSVATAGLDETRGKLGELRNAVHTIEHELETVNHPEVVVPMLMMRRHEKDFLARLDPAYAAEVKARLPEFEGAVRAAGLAPALQADLMQKMTTYQQAFAEMAKVKLEEVAEAKRLTAADAALEPMLIDLVGGFDKALQTARAESAEAKAWTNRMILAWLGAAIVAMALLAWLVGRSISRPVATMTAAMRALSGGNLTVDIPAHGRRDEIGEMAKSVQVFKDTMIEAERLRAEQEAQKQRAAAERREAMLALATRFESSVGGIVESVSAQATELQATAQAMTDTSEQTSRRAATVAAASEQATANVQTVASATEQLSASIGEIGQQVTRSSGWSAMRWSRPIAANRAGPRPGGGRPEDRRRREADQRDRRSDQPAGAQRDDRGGARRRRRQGLRRGRLRGQGAGQPDRQGDRRDSGPDQGDPGRDLDRRCRRSRTSPRPSARSARLRPP